VAGRFALVGRLLRVLPSYAQIGWWGLVAPRVSEDRPLTVLQGVVISEGRLLLSMRSDLWGWELPGGAEEPGESPAQALHREIREETGLEIEVDRHVGDYVRSGFRPHTARVYLCHPVGGVLRSSSETPALRWFDAVEPPDTLFPWYDEPLRDALGSASEPVLRREIQGLDTVLAAIRIDLRMRLATGRARPGEGRGKRGAPGGAGTAGGSGTSKPGRRSRD
jgi:8-oxo-dGTP pyrophosphatase MutT (NUDIX family)